MFLKIKKLHPDAKIPERNNNDDAGLDLFALENCRVTPGQVTKVKTGISIQVCHESDDFDTYCGFICDRSSMGVKGFGKLAGIIDQGYVGEIMVLLTDHTYPKVSTTIQKGDKIAQIVYQKVETPRIEVVEELSETSRGNNGFGSSGR